MSFNSQIAPVSQRSIVLVGLMGAGKTAIGKRLAARLNLPFHDADEEIERAAGMSIAEIFKTHGEGAFRAGEKRVIQRLLGTGRIVLATGGGAFMDAETRTCICQRGDFRLVALPGSGAGAAHRRAYPPAVAECRQPGGDIGKAFRRAQPGLCAGGYHR